MLKKSSVLSSALLICGGSLAWLPGTAAAGFNPMNIMNPSQWFGGNKDRYYDRDYYYDRYDRYDRYGPYGYRGPYGGYGDPWGYGGGPWGYGGPYGGYGPGPWGGGGYGPYGHGPYGGNVQQQQSTPRLPE